MWKEFNTIKYLRSLRKRNVNGAFLARLRTDLSVYMKANPAPQPEHVWAWDFFRVFTEYKLVPALVIVLFIMLSGGSMAFASQGSLPGEPLYPVKLLTENVRTAFAFTPQSKERLEISFAAERVEEIKALVGRNTADASGLDVALSRLNDHMDQASRLIEKEKDKGKDVQNLVAQAESGFATQQSDLEKAFNAQRSELRTQIKDVQNKIDEAKKSGSADQINTLSEQAAALKNARKNINTARDEAAKAISKQRDNLARAMKTQQAALSAIQNAKSDYQNLIDEITKNNLILPADTFSQYTDLIAQASAAYSQGDFSGARQSAKDASASLDIARHTIDQTLEQADNNQNQPAMPENSVPGSNVRFNGRDGSHPGNGNSSNNLR